MPTYKLTIEYEGTRYSGWQSQVNTPKTIQGRLMRIASEVFGASEIGGAGRTDAGVHAAGQVAHLRIHKAVDPILMTRKINDLLPHDFSAFTDKRLKADESRIVVVEAFDVAQENDLILIRIVASHFLWKMVRKLVAYLVEIGRGAPNDLES